VNEWQRDYCRALRILAWGTAVCALMLAVLMPDLDWWFIIH
jgi:hypothetical protein